MGTDSTPYLSTVYDRARRAPDAVAFEISGEEEDRRLTYAELIERVSSLGYALHSAGFGDGERVALCMENRPEWPVSYLAAWYAGSIAVPLDPQLEASLLGNLLRHSEATVCITSSALLPKLGKAFEELEKPPRLLLVDPEPPDEAPEPVTTVEELLDEHPAPSGEDWEPRPPAEFGSIMYTSGTTGDPKGVMVGRQAVVENLESALQVIQFSDADRLLAVLPLFHVLPLIANCLGPLYLGASVVFLGELTAEKILAAFRKHEITVFVCVPAFFYRFHDRLRRGIEELGPLRRRLARVLLWLSATARRRLGLRLGRRLLPAAHRPFGDQMRLFVTGGARFDPEVYQSFLDWGFTLAQGYGLTEATAVLTVSPLDDLRADTVGRAIPGVELRIHEPDDSGVGEIEARGPNVMEGYYRNREATEKVIVDGWLRTGDLGRLLDDGHLQITGRAKDVIVLSSGKNIYPEELEAHYGQSDLIEEICIVGLPDEQGRGERLHAVVVPDREAARGRGYVNIRDMVKWELDGLGATLPGPQRITSMELRSEPLPRTTTRKVKRFEVLEEVRERRERGAEPDADEAAARPAEEEGSEPDEQPEWARQTRRIIARAARRDRVGPDDHLDVDLGLESLDRLELFAELQERLGVRLEEEVTGELHSVGEVLEAVGERVEGDGEAQELEPGERWERVLGERPEGIEPYLRRRPLSEAFLWGLARLLRPILRLVSGHRVTGVDNLPDDYPFLICANHFSYIDPFVLSLALPLRVFRRIFFVGYAEYFAGGIAGLLGRWVRNIPIDANRHLERAMQAAAEGLRQGMVLVIFPEGGRSIDGEVQRFRGGAAILARQLDLPLVPVGIWGTYEMWPRGGKLRPHPVGIAIGEPISPRSAAAEELHEHLRQQVVELVDVAHRLHEES